MTSHSETKKVHNQPEQILSMKLLPADSCVLCQKTLDEIGGRRLTATGANLVHLSDKYRGGGDKRFPYQSVKLTDDGDTYVVVQGTAWTAEAIDRAKETFLKGLHPWFCQVCGHRQCSKCGFPLNYPVAADVLYDDGENPHYMIIPADLGCINPRCEKYKIFIRNGIDPRIKSDIHTT